MPDGPKESTHLSGRRGNGMKRVAVLLTVLALVLALAGCSSSPQSPQSGTVAWTQQFGTSNYDDVFDVTVDASGNAYVTGYTFGSLQGTNAGKDDIIVAKFSPTGQRAWLTQIGTPVMETGYRIALDSSGNIYVGGTTQGNLGGTNPGTTNLSDPYLAKFNASGANVWVKQFGTSGNDDVSGLAIDANNRIFVSGDTTGDMQGTNAGSYDAFIARYDASGTQVWLKQYGSTGDDRAIAVSVDSSGNEYVTGWTTGNLQGTNAGGKDAYLAKFDASGNQLWIHQFGTTGDDQTYSATTTSSGDTYIVGGTTGALGGPNAGATDAFLAKYGASGNQLWIKQFGTTADDDAEGVTLATNGDIIVTGGTNGNLAGTNAGQSDAYIAEFDPSGNQVWIRQFGTTGDDWGQGVAVDNNDNVLVDGATSGNLTGTNQGLYDAYLRKYWH